MDQRQQYQPRPLIGALRLTFRVSGGAVRLEKVERVNKISPPMPGEWPKAGKNSGFWLELRGERNRVLACRLLNNPLGDSAEVHSPEGKIERVFGPVTENAFEALLPDLPEARSVALMGDYLSAEERDSGQAKAARELARFDLPGGKRGGETGQGGGPR